MSRRRTLPLIALLAALAASAPPARASSEQVAWVRRAAGNFVRAELDGSGANACGVLEASLRTTRRGRSCAERWDARIAELLRAPGARARLRAQLRQIASASVTVHGRVASLELATPLTSGPNRFVWSENCWMLAS